MGIGLMSLQERIDTSSGRLVFHMFGALAGSPPALLSIGNGDEARQFCQRAAEIVRNGVIKLRHSSTRFQD
jgi:hypothetical protein